MIYNGSEYFTQVTKVDESWNGSTLGETEAFIQSSVFYLPMSSSIEQNSSLIVNRILPQNL